MTKMTKIAKEAAKAFAPVLSVLDAINEVYGAGRLSEDIIKSQQDFEVKLASDIESLKGRVSEKVSAEEAYEIALKAIRHSWFTTSKEKRQRFRNVVINSLNPEFDNEDAKKLFLKMVADFEDVHIQVLNAYRMTAKIEMGSKTYNLGPVDERLIDLLRTDGAQVLPYEAQEMTGWGTISASFISNETIIEYLQIGKDNLRKVISDLESNGCLLMRGDDYERFYRLSAFGARFLLFISEDTAESFLVK